MSPLIPNEAMELRQLQEHLRRQYNKHLAVTEDIARALESLDKAIARLELEDERQSTNVTGVAPYSPLRPTGWAKRLDGMTQMEALIAIAEDNDGMVKATDARDILVRSGLAKGQPKNVATTVHHLLGSSDEFERLGPGLYRLKSMRNSSDRDQDGEPSADSDPEDEIVVLSPFTVMGATVPAKPARATLFWDDDRDQLDARADDTSHSTAHGQAFGASRASSGGVA